MKFAMQWPWNTNGEDPAIYLDDVYRYARARLRSREDAEDVAIEVVQELPTPCRRKDLLVYMIGMARRKVAGRLRTAREISGILELAVGVNAGFVAWGRIIAFTRRQRCDLTLTCHFEPVMIYYAFANAFTTDKDTVIA